MGRQRTVQSDGSRYTVPDEIMNLRTPLHCLKRNIAQCVHAKVQREIAEHDETSSEAEPSNRHLVAKNAGCDCGNRGFHDGLGLSLLAAPTNILTPHRTRKCDPLATANRYLLDYPS